MDELDTSAEPTRDILDSPVNEEDDDDDFGSFDEASVEGLQAPDTPTTDYPLFTTEVLDNPSRFDESLAAVLGGFIPNASMLADEKSLPILNEDGHEYLAKLSKMPHLNPPNWTKLKLRHELLIKLGVPINLDELDTSTMHKRLHQRKLSISEHDINWDGFVIPNIEELHISGEVKEARRQNTSAALSEVEQNLLSNTSQMFLENSSVENLDAKLLQLLENYKTLLELSSIWQDQMRELKHSQEVYESVVQNIVGYNQKLQRQEIMDNLKKMKSKSRKSKRTF